MKFPQSRTEIMDQVAVFASDAKLPDNEKEPLIRLALMHWNHVPDKSMPEETYEGFDPDWVSPVKQLNLHDLIEGAIDYVDQRCNSLNNEIADVSRQLWLTERSRSSPDEEYSFVSEMNDLYKEKARIVDQLGVFGYQVIDREVEFNIYNGDMRENKISPDKLQLIAKNIVTSDEELEIAVDMDVVDHRDSTSFVFYSSSSSVDDLVSGISEAFMDAGMAKEDLDVTIREYSPSIPNFKHTGDQAKLERNKQKMKEQLSNDSFDLQ